MSDSMTHREAIKRLGGLRDILTETLMGIEVKPAIDGNRRDAQTADVVTAIMRMVWQGYLEAIEHAIEQLGRMEGLEQ